MIGTSELAINIEKKIPIGGAEQWIDIKAVNKDKPMLLFLHGGPGVSIKGAVKHFLSGLYKDYIVVNWDQRGAGKSYSKKLFPDKVSLELILNDIILLAEYLHAEYPGISLTLIGHSMGAFNGIQAIAKRPELFKAFIGVGQCIDFLKSEQRGYRFALEKAECASDLNAVSELKAIPFDDQGNYRKELDSFRTQRKYLGKYGGISYDPDFVNKWAETCAYSGEVTLIRTYRFVKAMENSLKIIWKTAVNRNLMTEIDSLEVPVYMISGEADNVTPVSFVNDFLSKLHAPRKKHYIIKKAGHYSCFEQPERFIRILHKLKL